MPHNYPHLLTLSKTYTTIPLQKSFIPPSTTLPKTSAIANDDGNSTKEDVKPRILWIGCSDSIISETEILNVDREEIFVHRNFGGLVSNGDLSSRSAIEWAVGELGVDYIIICGHYDCALIKERDGEEFKGWHASVSKLHDLYAESHGSTAEELDNAGQAEKDKRSRELEELSVIAEVEWLKKQEPVKTAIEGRGLKVTGVVFDRRTGQGVRILTGEEGKKD